MFKGDNLIGVLLVGLCLVAAAIMVWAIATDRELSYNGPAWLPWILGGIILIGSIWGIMQGRRGGGGGGSQWPNPNAGQRSLLDRLRGKKDDPSA
jgi:hypothetical protein